MFRRIGNWLRPGREVDLPFDPRDWEGERKRYAKPAFDRALRRGTQDWPLAGPSVGPAAPRLGNCRRWVYQLQGINWERLEASVADVAVIDLAADGATPAFSRAQIDRMRARPGGGQTTILCYLSIGAAEPWRSYWNPGWFRSRPAWMTASHGEWGGTVLTQFWHAAWQDIVVDRPDSMLRQILAAGFDGVALDRIDAFEYFRAQGRASAPDEMIELVAKIGTTAWRTVPAFLVVPINGEELLGSRRYRDVISGIIHEDLLYRPDYSAGQDAVVANNDKFVASVMSDLTLALADGIPVLGTEYLRDHPEDEALIPAAAERLRSLGLVPYFAPRRLNRLCVAG